MAASADISRWKFVQLSDPHLGSQRDGKWNNYFLCSMMPDVIQCLKEDLAQIQPDFLLVTGDVASQQTRDAMFAARDLLDSLNLPYYPMGGNHDFVLKESREWFLDAFRRHLPVQRTYYSFNHKNLHFAVLDPWWKWGDGALCMVSEARVAAELDVDLKDARWALPPHQLEWLQNDLESHMHMPTFVATHYPALPIPDRLRQPGMRDGGCLDNGELLLEIAAQFPQVRGIISGHLHMHYIEPVNGLLQIVTGALPEFPTEYRLFSVYEDHVEVETRGLSDKSFARRSLIPGKSWTEGQSQDRAAHVALRPAFAASLAGAIKARG